MDNDIFGHINNVVYYSFFDTVVNGALVEAGLFDLNGAETVGLVVETQCRYFAPLAFPDTLEGGLRVEHLGTSSVRYGIGIFRAGAEAAAAAGHFVHVYVDRASRRPKRIPAEIRVALERLR
jgi:acyl-CoA thioester hydrolase